ncbi:MAG: DEAD/DEAH box helicase, partial [Sphingobacteriia bacterium]|nr:DEAD/DEAH box helicase [Sphingobacteriia bacterium]
GFTVPTEIQKKVIEPILDGKDVMGLAQTGTGKTAAFAIPILHRLMMGKQKRTRVLIIAPTRELAMQIDQQLEGFSYFAGISSIAVYGGGSGTDFEVERKAIKTGTGVIVATPGRLISHLNLGYVNLDKLTYLVLDEADRMLDMGFLPDIMKIISFLPKKRQTLMFSATMPPEIRKLAKKIMNAPEEITLEISKPPENVLQAAYLVENKQKSALLKKLITGKELPSVLVFLSTKSSVKELEQEMLRMKFNVRAIHSDLDQNNRTEVLRRFKNREIQILVATDIVSRGIDVEDISLVVNFNVPHDAEDYVHRVGRTARAEKSGIALTFVSKNELQLFKKIEHLIGNTIKILPLPGGLSSANSATNDQQNYQNAGKKIRSVNKEKVRKNNKIRKNNS